MAFLKNYIKVTLEMEVSIFFVFIGNIKQSIFHRSTSFSFCHLGPVKTVISFLKTYFICFILVMIDKNKELFHNMEKIYIYHSIPCVIISWLVKQKGETRASGLYRKGARADLRKRERTIPIKFLFLSKH